MTPLPGGGWPGSAGVHIRRWMPVSPAKAFESFTDPAMLRQWWKPRGFTVDRLEFPAREGEEYHVRLRGPDGTWFAHTGTFLEVVPGVALVYTWRWIEGPMLPDETLVEVRFSAERGGVTIDLSHSRFATRDEADRHGGWIDAFDALEGVLTSDTIPDPRRR